MTRAITTNLDSKWKLTRSREKMNISRRWKRFPTLQLVSSLPLTPRTAKVMVPQQSSWAMTKDMSMPLTLARKSSWLEALLLLKKRLLVALVSL
jgi:hypothetical protein